MLDIIDDFLLVKMQKFTDWVQQVFGVVKFDIHKWVVILDSVFFCMFALASLDPLCFLFSLIISFLTLIKVRLIESDKRNWMAGKQAIRYNASFKDITRKKVLIFQGVISFLVIYLFLLSSSVVAFWFLAWSLLDVVDTYIGACTPKPPGKSKTRGLYEKLLAQP